MPPRSVSHYEIERKIGEGGMGEIYLARDVRLDRPVALKFLPAHLSNDPKARERLLREAKAASKLSHPNILTVHEVGEDESGNVFIAMAYVEGETLEDQIARGNLSISRTLEIAIQICEGLSRAHSAGIIHRDIKPSNVLVDSKGHATILDFGLAKVFDTAKLTQTGAMVGTMAYMSPEQARGDLIDQRSDIFSLGAVLYEMVTGKNPFEGDNPAAVLFNIINQDALPPSRVNSECPPGLEVAILMALAKNPENRYQSVDDLMSDLQREQRLLSISDSHPPGPAIARLPRPKHRRRSLIPAAGVLLGGLAFAIFNPWHFSLVTNQDVQADRNTLAVMYFDNVADPADADKSAQMITSLLITDLSESKFLSVVSRQRLFDILKQLGHNDQMTIDRTVASDVAKEAKASWVLTGSILRTAPEYVLVSSIADADNGRILSSQRVEGHSGEELFSVVDRLAAAIRGDLQLPAAADKETSRPIADATTHSAEAYRHYLAGLDDFYQINYLDATAEFNKATQCDSTFALAYFRLARVNRVRMLYTDADKAIRQAIRFKDRTTPQEQRYIDVELAYADGRMDDALATLKEITAANPQDKEACMGLADVYLGRQMGREAAEYYERVAVLDPTFKTAYNNMTYAYEMAGDYPKALQAVNRYIAMAPNEANPYDTRGDVYARHGQIEEAIGSYRQALQQKQDFMPSATKLGYMYLFEHDYVRADSAFQMLFASTAREDHANGRVSLALIPLFQGKLQDALTLLEQGSAADHLEQVDPIYIAQKHFWKSDILLELKRAPEALAEGEKAARLMVQSGLRNRYFGRAEYISLLAANHRFGPAQDSLRALEADIRKTDSSRMGACWLAAARVARAQKDPAAALACLRKIKAPNNAFVRDYEIAANCLDLGDLGEAVETLKRLAGEYDDVRISAGLRAVTVHYLLGRAYEQSGWKDEAIKQYREFLEYWQSPEPQLADVNDARARLVKLQTQI